MFRIIKCVFISLIIITLLYLQGCQFFPSLRVPIEKNGKVYGVTEGLFQHRWWDYYKRALSYSDGAFWKEAELDLLEAIRQRSDDKKQARTYGMRYIEYFPHRELGIVLYRQGRIEYAIHELNASLTIEKSAKAEFYLDRARKTFIEKSQLDHLPPEIIIKSPEQNFLTNASSLVIHGIARDDTFIRYIKVNTKEIRVDVSNREISFCTEVSLNNTGKNEIPIWVTDLSGKTSHSSLIINVDRTGPVISLIEEPPEDALMPGQEVELKIYAYDISGVVELIINRETFLLDGSQESNIRKSVLLHPDNKELVIKVKDRAGNVNTLKIPLSRDRVNKIEKWPNLLAENSAHSKTVLTDITERMLPRVLSIKTPSQHELTMSESTRQKQTSSHPANLTDRTMPVIEMRGSWKEQTYLSQALIEGMISDNKGIESLFINGEQILRLSTPVRKLYFNHVIRLNQGKNTINILGTDTSGNSNSIAVKIVRYVPSIRKIDSRLQVAVNTFKREIIGKDQQLSEGFEELLVSAMIESKRFFVKPTLLQEIISDRDKILNYYKKDGVDCVLFGSVLERIHAGSMDSVSINVQMVDTETGDILASADSYGENVDFVELKALAKGLALKLADELPVVDGIILKTNGRRITVDIGEEKKIKKGMKLIIYKTGEPIKNPVTGEVIGEDVKELGQAIIESVKNKTSYANLVRGVDSKAIQASHRVITR